jgi:phospholipid-binding lipoprotein MlaA
MASGEMRRPFGETGRRLLMAALLVVAGLGASGALVGCSSDSADQQTAMAEPTGTPAEPDQASGQPTEPTAPAPLSAAGQTEDAGQAAEDGDEAMPTPADGAEPMSDDSENDPLEGMNRYFFEINYALDETIFKAVAGWYRLALPDPAQEGIRNALRNLKAPVILANDLFQGEIDRAGTTFARFLINSTAGLGGLFDVASTMGLKYHDEDFGQTLGVYGVSDYPYLVIPVLGPSNVRDGVGRVVDAYIDPFGYLFPALGLDEAQYVRAGLSGVDARARNLDTLDDIRETSLDYYATIRSLYRQSRAAAVRNQEDSVEGAPVFLDEEGGEETTPPATGTEGTEGEGAKAPAEMLDEGDQAAPAPAPEPAPEAESDAAPSESSGTSAAPSPAPEAPAAPPAPGETETQEVAPGTLTSQLVPQKPEGESARRSE